MSRESNLHFFISFIIVCVVVFPFVSSNLNEKDSEHENIKHVVSEWLKLHSKPSTFKCKFNVKSSRKNTFRPNTNTSNIRTFPCESTKNTLPYQFLGGTIKNGYLSGKGKLSFISEKEWLRFPEHKRIELVERNVCFDLSNLWNKKVQEIIGNFKDGFLHGKAKVVFSDKTFSITHYDMGKVHGYQRLFGSNGVYEESGIYVKGSKNGYHWKMVENHLIYLDTSMMVDNVKPTIIFPILRDGRLDDPIAGTYHPLSGAVDNVRKVLLNGIISGANDCLLQISFELLQNESFSYSIPTRRKFPLFGYSHSSLCDITPRHNLSTPSKLLTSWFNEIDDIMKPKRIGNFQPVYILKAHEILWRMNTIITKPDLCESSKLISNLHMSLDSNSLVGKIFGSQLIRMKAAQGTVTLNDNYTLNGYNDIWVLEEDQELVPNNTFLGCTPIRVSGYFKHGHINGLTRIETKAKTVVWVITDNGVLHGPSITYGIPYILERVRILELSK